MFFGPSDLKIWLSYHFQPRKYNPGEDLITEGEKVMEILMIIDGVIGIGPVVNFNTGEHKPFVCFRRGRTVCGDYSILLEKPSFATYRAYGSEIVNAFAIPKQPFMQLLELP
jgi:hypothetical protein